MQKEVGAECVAITTQLMEENNGMGMLLEGRAQQSCHVKELITYDVTSRKGSSTAFDGFGWRLRGSSSPRLLKRVYARSITLDSTRLINNTNISLA